MEIRRGYDRRFFELNGLDVVRLTNTLESVKHRKLDFDFVYKGVPLIVRGKYFGEREYGKVLKFCNNANNTFSPFKKRLIRKKRRTFLETIISELFFEPAYSY